MLHALCITLVATSIGLTEFSNLPVHPVIHVFDVVFLISITMLRIYFYVVFVLIKEDSFYWTCILSAGIFANGVFAKMITLLHFISLFYLFVPLIDN